MNALIHTGQTSIKVDKHDVLSNNLRHVHSKLNTKTLYFTRVMIYVVILAT